MSKTIAIITGTRAEYGLLTGISRELREQGATVQLIVTGAHLSAAHGMTVNHIEEPIAARVDMHLQSDTPLALATATGRATSGLAEALSTLNPDLVVILGDRYEMLAAATAAFLLHIPIAHIHGGEVTEGAQDESIRHAITKLSYWHFPSTESHAARIRQLGEAPARIFPLGAPGIDALAHTPIPRAQLEKELAIPFKSPTALLTYHPETLSAEPVESQIASVISAMQQRPNTTWIITGANADVGGLAINTALQAFAEKTPNAVFHMSLGLQRYASTLREVDVVIGNSSSALIEAPVIGTPAVNIGDRQKGRTRAENVIDCPCDPASITAALDRALRQPRTPSTLFGTPGEVSPAIAKALLSLEIPPSGQKHFHNI